MVSSALYRYVASRDDLLTLLIVEAYDSLGDWPRPSRPPPGPTVRRPGFAAPAAVRGVGGGHPHEYALLYGSPVPGYAAPDDTSGPEPG